MVHLGRSQASESLRLADVGPADPAPSSDLCRNAVYKEDSLFILFLFCLPQFGDISYLHKRCLLPDGTAVTLCFSQIWQKKEHRRFFFGNMVALQYLKSSLSLRGDFLTTTSGLDYLDHQLTSSAFRQNGACTSWGWVEPGSPGQLTSSHQAAPWKVLPIGTFVLWRKVMSTH